jgi:hypothetical protein
MNNPSKLQRCCSLASPVDREVVHSNVIKMYQQFNFDLVQQFAIRSGPDRNRAQAAALQPQTLALESCLQLRGFFDVRRSLSLRCRSRRF